MHVHTMDSKFLIYMIAANLISAWKMGMEVGHNLHYFRLTRMVKRDVLACT